MLAGNYAAAIPVLRHAVAAAGTRQPDLRLRAVRPRALAAARPATRARRSRSSSQRLKIPNQTGVVRPGAATRAAGASASRPSSSGGAAPGRQSGPGTGGAADGPGPAGPAAGRAAATGPNASGLIWRTNQATSQARSQPRSRLATAGRELVLDRKRRQHRLDRMARRCHAWRRR